MPNEQELCKRLDAITDKLSTQVRTLGLGLLAFSGSLLLTSATQSGTRSATAPFPSWVYSRVLLIGAIALAVLMFDLLQYVSSYGSSRRLLDKLEARQKQMRKDGKAESEIAKVEEKYDYKKDILHRASRWFFWLKVIGLVSGTLWLAVVAVAFFRTRSS